MQSRADHMDHQEQHSGQRNTFIGFEQLKKEYDDEMSMNNSSGIPKFNSSFPYQPNKVSSSDHPSSAFNTSLTSSSRSSKSHGNFASLSLHLCTPLLSAIYSEMMTFWFKQDWLIYADNHKETFLILNSDITGYLTVQMAIDQKSFTNNKRPLLYRPECLLIRTEAKNKSLFLPNTTISLERLFHRKNRSDANIFQGKLIAIICTSNDAKSKLMFYKQSRSNDWYIFFNDPTISASESFSNMLSNEEHVQLESILQQTNHTSVNHSSQLSFPLSALSNHPITYVYLTETMNADQ